ncbi:MAG TPA: sugar ABC transporter permease [Euzebyales bacterium]|nr:sugar ABC transporter permease [Euzebyales bacterium]
MLKIANGVIAVAAGVAGAMVLFWVLNALVERLPPKWEQRLKPYVFAGPALAALALFLVFPAVLTIRDSFFDSNSTQFVGLRNYTTMLGQSDVLSVFFNNIIWIIMVPTFSVIFGLAVAVLADRLKPRWENVSKSVIFLPMAISFVGAATIWNFVYAFRPPGRPQIGLFNAIWTAIGFQPVAWLQTPTLRLNTLLLTIVMIWMQAGFAMVLLSAAIKSVPEETIEAARIDGATEVQSFFRVVIPQIKSTIFVVFTTITILVMKIFDIVFALTGGNYNTDVVANRFYFELFRFFENGRAAVLVVVLMLAIIPLMIANIRRFREEEAIR